MSHCIDMAFQTSSEFDFIETYCSYYPALCSAKLKSYEMYFKKKIF
jgi:hypothetical protein